MKWKEKNQKEETFSNMQKKDEEKNFMRKLDGSGGLYLEELKRRTMIQKKELRQAIGKRKKNIPEREKGREIGK